MNIKNLYKLPPELTNIMGVIAHTLQNKATTVEKFNTFVKPKEILKVNQAMEFLRNNKDIAKKFTYLPKTLAFMDDARNQSAGADAGRLKQLAARSGLARTAGKLGGAATGAAGWLVRNL